MNWFYESGGTQQGPVSEAEFEQLIAQGTITPGTLVWREGQGDWKPLREVRPAIGVPPPPPLGQTPGASFGQPEPGFVRCSLTGKQIPESEAVYIQGKPYSAEAKPIVLQSLQQGGMLPSTGTERTGPAWENRQQLGFFTAFWETIKNVLIKPSETFATMRREGGLSAPLYFNIIAGSIGGIAGLFYQFLMTSMTGSTALRPNNPADQLVASMTTGVGLIVLAILMPLFIALISLIYAGILHLCLRICGGARQPFETTFRVYSYSMGSASFLQIIPLCGGLVSGIWSLVATCIGISRAHEITTGRAVLAVLLPLIVCCGLVFAFFMFMAVGTSGNFQ